MALNFSNFGQVIEEPDNPYNGFSSLLNAQSTASNQSARIAADRADPMHQYKPQIAGALSKLLSNPGDVTTSPYYKFAQEQGMEAVTRANKGVDSGKYMADLQRFGTGLAGQQFGQLASLYNSILGGSATGGAQMLMGGFGRGQDQQAIAAGLKAAGQGGNRPPQQQQSGGFDLNALMARYGITPGGGSPAGGTQYGLPSGGYNNYTPTQGGTFNSSGTYVPSTYRDSEGNGYIGDQGSGYYSVSDPYSIGESNPAFGGAYSGYTPDAYSGYTPDEEYYGG